MTRLPALVSLEGHRQAKHGARMDREEVIIIAKHREDMLVSQFVPGGPLLPPSGPPKPPLPQGIADGVITSKVISNIVSTVIDLALADQHPQLLTEAQGKLAEYLLKHRRTIGPATVP